MPNSQSSTDDTAPPTLSTQKVCRSMRTSISALTDVSPTMSAVPRSGWAMMSPSGSAMSAPGVTSSRKLHASLRGRRCTKRDTASSSESFMNSLG